MRRGKALVGYGLQLREKQKVKRIYFVLEGQFRNYFERAARMKGITGENLLFLLERRLDNAVYRAGFSTSRRQARQLVNHGHILVNGKKVDIPSYQVRAGEAISIKEASRKNPHIEGAWQTASGRVVNERGGEARANTQWSVLTPGGDVIKESIGAFPRVILAEGEYRVVARNDNKTFEGEFRVVNGVDREVEVIAR